MVSPNQLKDQKVSDKTIAELVNYIVEIGEPLPDHNCDDYRMSNGYCAICREHYQGD